VTMLAQNQTNLDAVIGVVLMLDASRDSFLV